jgi:hypothetical protein
MKKLDSAIQPVVILNSESQHLANAQAQFLFSENLGLLWTQGILTQVNRDNLLKFATTLRTLDDHLVS